MDYLFSKALEFIPSETMKEYLTALHNKGIFSFSAEDVLSLAYNSDNSFKQRFDCIRGLDEYISDKAAYKQICDAAALLESDFTENGLYLYTKEYIYSDDDDDYEPIGTEELVFHTVEEAVAHVIAKEKGCICCKLMKDGKVLLDMVYIDDEYVYSFYTTRCKDEFTLRYDERNDTDNILCKYVYIPNPFEPGDTVCSYDEPEIKYIIIDAEPPRQEDFNGLLDHIDASAMVVPYNIREHATPEKIKLHYERLTEERKNSNYVSIDEISKHHDHICTIFLELVEKAVK